MEYQAQQIKRFHGDYGQFLLSLFAEGIESRRFVVSMHENVQITLSFDGFEDHCCKFYFGADRGVLVNGKIPERSYSNGSSTVKATINTEEEGLFFFHFELERDGRLLYLSPSGLTDSFAGEWQLLICGNKFEITESGGVIYHIFTDRFAKGGNCPPREDAVMLDWQRDIPEYTERPGQFLRNNTFFGGTLWGVLNKLDYIGSLGADMIYLSPVFTAYSNHKYDTGDYLSVDPMFGGDDALQAVIDGCHARNIKVILDGVFNHVGDDSIYFDSKNKYGGALHNPHSPYREWFNISPDGGYECWWGVKNLPKVIKCESFQAFICEKVIPKYMNMGIDGWRLDVVDEYSQSFLERITAAAKEINPDTYILGEVWENASNKIAYGERKKYLCGSALDGVMNYPFRNAVIDFVTEHDNSFITDVTTQIFAHYPASKLNSSMNMLGTHDTARIITVLGGVSGDGLTGSQLAHTYMTHDQYTAAKKKLFAAYLLMTALPGKTAVYYGDEAGMQGYSDPFNRRPFPWGSEDGEITTFVRNANLVKKSCMPLISGDFDPIPTQSDVFAFRRTSGSETVTCISNMGSADFGFMTPHLSLTDGIAIDTVKSGETKIFQGDVFK